MLIGFERLTEDLKATDLPAAKVIAEGLLLKRGKAMAVTNEQIREGLKQLGHTVSDIKVRKIIHALRFRGVVKCLVATSKGYYITNNARELDRCIESLAQRQRSINEIQLALQDQRDELTSSAIGTQTNFFD